MEKLSELIRRLGREGFYGKLILTYRDGTVVHAIEEKSHKFEIKSEEQRKD